MITTTNTNDIYGRGNDYDQHELFTWKSPCGPYVTLVMFNQTVNYLIQQIQMKQDKLDIEFIEYNGPEREKGE